MTLSLKRRVVICAGVLAVSAGLGLAAQSRGGGGGGAQAPVFEVDPF